MPNIDNPTASSMCQFCQSIPGHGTNWCFAYALSKKYQGYHWSEYPSCCQRTCPLIRPELLKPLINHQLNNFQYSIETPWGKIWFKLGIARYQVDPPKEINLPPILTNPV